MTCYQDLNKIFCQSTNFQGFSRTVGTLQALTVSPDLKTHQIQQYTKPIDLRGRDSQLINMRAKQTQLMWVKGHRTDAKWQRSKARSCTYFTTA